MCIIKSMKKPNIKINKNAVGIIKGLTICLFALLIMLSSNVTGLSWLSTGILASFGFIGFWILIPFLFLVGIYVMIYKKIAKTGLGVSLFGLFIIVIFVSIMCTNFLLTNVSTIETGGVLAHSKYLLNDKPFYLSLETETLADGTIIKHYLEIDSAIHYFGQVSDINNDTIANFHSNGGFIITNSALGGGFLGFFFAGMMNSAFTPAGTTSICIIMMVIGVCLVFNIQLRRLFKNIAGRIKKQNSSEENKIENQQPLNESVINISSTEKMPNNVVEEFSNDEITSLNSREENIAIDESTNKKEEIEQINLFNDTHGLQKAHFSSDLDSDKLLNQNNPDGSLKPRVATFGYFSNFDSYIKNPENIADENVASANESDNSKQVNNSEVDIIENINNETNEETIKTVDNEINDVIDIPVEKKIKDVNEVIIEQKPRPLLPYVLPSLNLLKLREKDSDSLENEESCKNRVEQLNNVLNSLNLGAKVTGYTVGPSVTRFDLEMNSDKSISIIEKYLNDFSIRLGGVQIRFEKVVIGKSTSGIEMENEIRTIVGLRECLEKLPLVNEKTRTLVVFGKNITGDIIYADFTKFPHMMVAGTTGSGKSVFIHSLIITLLMRNRPEELRLVLIDPKKVEMARYKDVPHLLCPNISEAKEAYVAFKKLVDEMEYRYELLAKEGVSDINGYNEIMSEKGLAKIPYIICVVDEYADLNEQCKEIREPIHRIAQKARAAGIHLLLATQRPSVDVIDGVLKANISTRVALMVNAPVDSIVILGEAGAEKLLPNGDMIVDSPVISRGLKPRVQGAFCSSVEIMDVINFIKKQRGPNYDPKFLDLKDHEEEKIAEESLAEVTKVDKDIAEEKLYEIIKEDIMHKQFCSISYIQRSYGVGFPKAGRLFGRLQKEGYVELNGDAKGCKVIKKDFLDNSNETTTLSNQETTSTDSDRE